MVLKRERRAVSLNHQHSYLDQANILVVNIHLVAPLLGSDHLKERVKAQILSWFQGQVNTMMREPRVSAKMHLKYL